MISIIAKFTVNDRQESRFLPLMKKLIEASTAEEGCVEYALQKHTEKPNAYCLIEKWKDQQAVDTHNKSIHFTTIVPELLKVATVEIDVYETV